MSKSTNEIWKWYLVNLLYEIRKQTTPIKGYSDMLIHDLEALQKLDPSMSISDAFALLPISKTPEHTGALLSPIHDAVENLADILIVLDEKIRVLDSDQGADHESDDQKWREYIVFFLSDWSSPLTTVVGISELLEMFLEALVQHGNDSIPVESGSFKSEMTPQMALELMRNIRRSAQALDHLKSKVREDLSRPFDAETGSEPS